MNAELEVLTAVTMKSATFWDVTPCCGVEFGDVSEECSISTLLAALLATRSAYCSTPKMEASSETSVHSTAILGVPPQQISLFTHCQAYTSDAKLVVHCVCVSRTQPYDHLQTAKNESKQGCPLNDQHNKKS
jgi:hypothetical protein